VRPETIAFSELDTLVRNLSDQLAGYRRRALSAESRTRELEQVVAERDGTLIEVRADGLRSTQARALLEAKVRELEAKAEVARAELLRAQAAFAAAAEAAVVHGGCTFLLLLSSPCADANAPLQNTRSVQTSSWPAICFLCTMIHTKSSLDHLGSCVERNGRDVRS